MADRYGTLAPAKGKKAKRVQNPVLRKAVKDRYTAPDQRVGHTQDKFGGGAAPKRKAAARANNKRPIIPSTGQVKQPGSQKAPDKVAERTGARLAALGGTVKGVDGTDGYTRKEARLVKRARRYQKAGKRRARAAAKYAKAKAAGTLPPGT